MAYVQFPAVLRKTANLEVGNRAKYRMATIQYGRCPHHRVAFAWNHCPKADWNWDVLRHWGIPPALRTALSCPIDGDSVLVKLQPGPRSEVIFLTDEERDAAIDHLKGQLTAMASRLERAIFGDLGRAEEL